MKWKDKNEVIWNLKDMDEAHIKNCIKYLARHPNAENRLKIDEFRYELQRRLDKFNSRVDLIMQKNSSLDKSTVLCKLQDEIDKRIPDITGAPMGRATAYFIEGLRIAMRVVDDMESDYYDFRHQIS
jgi:hypothetical protein